MERRWIPSPGHSWRGDGPEARVSRSRGGSESGEKVAQAPHPLTGLWLRADSSSAGKPASPRLLQEGKPQCPPGQRVGFAASASSLLQAQWTPTMFSRHENRHSTVPGLSSSGWAFRTLGTARSQRSAAWTSGPWAAGLRPGTPHALEGQPLEAPWAGEPLVVPKATSLS